MEAVSIMSLVMMTHDEFNYESFFGSPFSFTAVAPFHLAQKIKARDMRMFAHCNISLQLKSINPASCCRISPPPQPCHDPVHCLICAGPPFVCKTP